LKKPGENEEGARLGSRGRGFKSRRPDLREETDRACHGNASPVIQGISGNPISLDPAKVGVVRFVSDCRLCALVALSQCNGQCNETEAVRIGAGRSGLLSLAVQPCVESQGRQGVERASYIEQSRVGVDVRGPLRSRTGRRSTPVWHKPRWDSRRHNIGSSTSNHTACVPVAGTSARRTTRLFVVAMGWLYRTISPYFSHVS
jgi:hypothetical protein